MNILILGATGFIGFQLANDLLQAGHVVTGMGRSVGRAKSRLSQISWIAADIGRFQTADEWTPYLDNCDIVINCAGALQDGLSDNLHAVQTVSQIALQSAALQSGIKLFIQISAETGGLMSDLEFLKTKRRADDALVASGLPHVIFRPSLVIGRNAFGGTALLRGLAAFPLIIPLVYPSSTAATVTMADLETAVRQAVEGNIPVGTDISLVANPSPSLEQLVLEHRKWLGIRPAKVLSLPDFLAAPVSKVADTLGKLGWRSPLRSTALSVMQAGVVSNQHVPPFKLESAGAFLQRNPAGVQDIWSARLYLLKPFIFLTLAVFWLASGIVPLFNPAEAAGHLAAAMGEPAALLLTFSTCALDILLGLLLLWRPFTRYILIATVSVSLAYLAGSFYAEPALWLNPLGPMVKVVPSIMLTVVALAILDER